MGQQPNIHLEHADLPRPTDHPGIPRRWSPGRVGEVGVPADVPVGGRFGNPGPDAGYALKLLDGRDLATGPGEHHRDAVVAVAAVMSARAAAFGRAPVAGDADVAEVILGYRGPASGPNAGRASAVAGLAHHPAASRPLIAAVGRTTLTAPLEEVIRRAASGDSLINL